MTKYRNMKLIMLMSLFGFLLIFPFQSTNAFFPWVCGDGEFESFIGEECDDGNFIDGDGCNSTCFIEAGFECTNTYNATSICVPICGDGIISSGEECDDGNSIDTDSCTNSCLKAVCGDGFIQAGEQCDDGNSINTDSCSNSCLKAVCGDGFIQAGVETCDDGNSITETCSYGSTCNVCDSTCQTAPGIVSTCGDSIVNGSEECDDGNLKDTDSCTNSCLKAACGDGFIQAGEQCDDGNLKDTDSCTNSCLKAACGDGFIQAGVETCDDGNTVIEACAYGDTSCTVCGSTCQTVSGTTSYCGDTITDSVNGEACDDGPTPSLDCNYGEASCATCNSACQEVIGTTHVCGDGVQDTSDGEQCDDGNTVVENCTYGETSCTICNSVCEEGPGATAFCGDHIVNGFEECDYDTGFFVAKNGDGCNSSCEKEPGYACFDDASGNNTCVFHCGEDVNSDGDLRDINVDLDGDGISDINEECDAGASNGNICTVTEYGETCNWCNSGCEEKTVRGRYCGDGALDIGNRGAACTASIDCDSNICDGTDNTCTAVEECDDGNLDNADGCSSCNIDSGYTCVIIAGISSCNTVCGDGACAIGSENCNNCGLDCGICSISPPTLAEEHEGGFFDGLFNGISDLIIEPVLRIKIPGLDFSTPEPATIEEVKSFDYGVTTFDFGGDVFNMDIISKVEDLSPGEDYVIFKIY